MAQAPDARAAIVPVRLSPAAGDIAVVFLRLQAVVRVTGLSRSTLYRLIADEQFPRPVPAWASCCRLATHRRRGLGRSTPHHSPLITAGRLDHACALAEDHTATGGGDPQARSRPT